MSGVFARQTNDRIDQQSERDLIAQLLNAMGVACPAAPRGPGSDCAALSTDGERSYRIASVDGVVFGRHFDLSTTPEAVGHKLVHRNLSDLAAAGAKPSDALLSLVLGGDVASPWLTAFARSVGKAAYEAGLEVVGGDVARGPEGHLAAHLAITGFAHRILARQGSQPGDILFVTGQLGGSRLGHHLSFRARLAEGEWLCGQADVHACTDLSDGLATDLPGLLGTTLGATINQASLPLAESARKLSKSDGIPAEEHAWVDGEDYELLFSVAANTADWLETNFRATFPHTHLTRIGVITAELGLREVTGATLPRQGFQHFGPKLR